MEQQDRKPNKEDPKKKEQSIPSLKERIEHLKEHNEFLEHPMKENLDQPDKDPQEESAEEA